MAQTDRDTDAANTGGSLSEIRQQRLNKLHDLAANDIDAYGGRVDGITRTADARETFEAAGDEAEESVTVAGRLTAKRNMGKSVFADVSDEDGRLQVYVQKNKVGEDAFNVFKSLDMGDIISVGGPLFRTRTGEVTVRAEKYQVLAKSLRPLPEKWHGLTDVEQRHRQRYLDLISNGEVLATFKRRIEIIRRIRSFLDERGFLEVETPMLQPIPGGAAARPFETYYTALGCPMYLRIAPELYLKRLLIGGFEKVYEINRNFRNEGLSRHHNPEFTMIEIYQAYGDCRTMMDLVEELVSEVAAAVLGTSKIESGPDVIDLERPWRRVAYYDLVREHLGENWYDLSLEEQRQRAEHLGVSVSHQMTATEVTHEIYEKVIEETLIQPTFVTRLPVHLVPLAKRCQDDPTVVDVFELEINGQEIAPGYSELNDPVEQRRRLEEQASVRHGEAAEGRLDEDFLVAMEHGMPPAGGMGIGIDRLVMTLLGVPSIRDVILFPQLRPLNQESR